MSLTRIRQGNSDSGLKSGFFLLYYLNPSPTWSWSWYFLKGKRKWTFLDQEGNVAKKTIFFPFHEKTKAQNIVAAIAPILLTGRTRRRLDKLQYTWIILHLHLHPIEDWVLHLRRIVGPTFPAFHLSCMDGSDYTKICGNT